MSYFSLFMNFLENIMSFEVLGITLWEYLITITLFTIVFNIIKSIRSKGE